MEKRLNELEIRITHQDQIIEDLNQQVTEQQRMIQWLSQQYAKFTEQSSSNGGLGLLDASQEAPPPHY